MVTILSHLLTNLGASGQVKRFLRIGSMCLAMRSCPAQACLAYHHFNEVCDRFTVLISSRIFNESSDICSNLSKKGPRGNFFASDKLHCTLVVLGFYCHSLKEKTAWRKRYILAVAFSKIQLDFLYSHKRIR